MHVVYTAFDAKWPRYTFYAIVSGYLLRLQCGNASRLKIRTNQPDFVKSLLRESPIKVFDDIEAIDFPLDFKAEKIRGALSVDKPALLLDCHTLPLDDLSHVFEASFDLAATPANWREDYGRLDAELVGRIATPSLNSGVLFLRKSANLCLEQWQENYRRVLFESGSTRAKDQPSLAQAIREIGPQVLHLPNNFNARRNDQVSGFLYLLHQTLPIESFHRAVREGLVPEMARISKALSAANSSASMRGMQSILEPLR